jgi:hypothetical protein
MYANPSSLDTVALTACLRASAGEERDRQVDFLRYLDPFDAREAWREAGYGSLWQFCLSELALREGAAGRRIGAMRVLREFPGLEAPLRDGRLSLTTAVTLRPVLTRENLDEMVARAAYKTDEETRYLVATLQPRRAPKEGIRKLSGAAPRLPAPGEAPAVEPEPLALTPLEQPPSRPSLDPVSAGEWSARLTIDRAFEEELETLKCLLSHKIPDGNLTAVLREAVRCAIEKHGKRRGAVKPERQRKSAAPSPPRPGKRQPITRGQARRLRARRRPVHLRLSRRPPLREPLAAGARPRPASRPRRTVHGRELAPPLQGPQHPARGGDVRPRAHGPVPAAARNPHG